MATCAEDGVQSGNVLHATGVVEDVDIGHGSFHVFGQKLVFDANKVRVFGADGKPTSIHALHRGAKVRFLLESEDTTRRRVSVVYLD